jgi:hypothetical protein
MNPDYYYKNDDDIRTELTSALIRLHEERCRRELAERELEKAKVQVDLLQGIVARGLAGGYNQQKQ